jgi:glycosyltransferase involved in cell wall biosynthesis
VAFRALGVRECMVEGRTGFVIEPGDFDGFRGALARLGSEPPALRSIRAAEARDFVRAAFDPARQVGSYLSLFESLLGDSRPPSRL